MDEDAMADYLFGEDDFDTIDTEAPVVKVDIPGGSNPKLQTNEQLQRRYRLIDLLLAHGFDVSTMKSHQREDLLSDVIGLNEPALLHRLIDIGALTQPDNDAIQWAIQMRCFDMVAPLQALGCAIRRVEAHWADALAEYETWLGRIRSTGNGVPRCCAIRAMAGLIS